MENRSQQEQPSSFSKSWSRLLSRPGQSPCAEFLLRGSPPPLFSTKTAKLLPDSSMVPEKTLALQVLEIWHQRDNEDHRVQPSPQFCLKLGYLLHLNDTDLECHSGISCWSLTCLWLSTIGHTMMRQKPATKAGWELVNKYPSFLCPQVQQLWGGFFATLQKSSVGLSSSHQELVALLINTPCTGLIPSHLSPASPNTPPSPTPLSHRCFLLPGIASQINCLHPNPWLQL